MHTVFQKFIDLLSSAEDIEDFSKARAIVSTAFDLTCFAYLALPRKPKQRPLLISTYAPKWISHYLQYRYESIDPVIVEALQNQEPFRWGFGLPSRSLAFEQTPTVR